MDGWSVLMLFDGVPSAGLQLEGEPDVESRSKVGAGCRFVEWRRWKERVLVMSGERVKWFSLSLDPASIHPSKP